MRKHDIDPFTGYVIRADEISGVRPTGPPVDLPPATYELRGLAALQRNADLFGLLPEDFKAMHWRSDCGLPRRPGDPHGCTEEARVPPEDPNVPDSPGAERRVRIIVNFADDGEVKGLGVGLGHAPIPVCREPAVTAERAREIAEAESAKTRPSNREGTSPGSGVAPAELGQAHLIVHPGGEYDRNGTQIAAIWRLVWAVDKDQGRYSVLVDAVAGTLVGERTNFIE